MWRTISVIILIIIPNIVQFKAEEIKNEVSSRSTISNNPEDIKFFAFPNAKKPDDAKPIIIGDTDSVTEYGLKKGVQVKILIHGLGPRICVMYSLKLAYLNEGFQNIILVDWTKLSTSSLVPQFSATAYASALKHVPIVGEKVAEFIQFLKTSQIISGASTVHILGHSLGSHIAGSAGVILKKNYSDKLGRITGLDPAGPFTMALGKNRLNKRQAKFVDVVHTDILVFGAPDALGHVDFYSNGGVGVKQPGCSVTTAGKSPQCGHNFAIVLFERSIEPTTIITACQCKVAAEEEFPVICAPPRKGQCKNATRFGEYASPKARGLYYVEATGAHAPNNCTA